MPSKTTDGKTTSGKSADEKPASAKSETAKPKATKAAADKGAPKAAKDPAPKKGTKVAKPAEGHKPNALQQPLEPSQELAAVVGEGKLARGEVVSKVWAYIKANDLQNPEDKREILADDKLRKVFGKDKVTMFEMNRHLAQHLK